LGDAACLLPDLFFFMILMIAMTIVMATLFFCQQPLCIVRVFPCFFPSQKLAAVKAEISSISSSRSNYSFIFMRHGFHPQCLRS